MLKANTLLTTKLLGIALLTSVLTSACKGGETSAKAIEAPPTAVKLQLLKSSQVQEGLRVRR
jgi:hypothetical protein